MLDRIVTRIILMNLEIIFECQKTMYQIMLDKAAFINMQEIKSKEDSEFLRWFSHFTLTMDMLREFSHYLHEQLSEKE